jgi:hypothetical protein
MHKTVCFLEEFYLEFNLHLISQKTLYVCLGVKIYDFLINNIFQLQFIATGRSVELVNYNSIVHDPYIGVCNTSGCCSCQRNFV